MQRPDPSEYAPYYSTYIDKVPDGDIFETLESSVGETVALLCEVPAAWARYRYAPEKWTLGEVIGHVIDAERVFSFRAFAIARGETADLPAMDQDQYATHSNAGDRPLAALLDELEAARRDSLLLLAGLDPSVHTRQGRASGFPFSVRTFAWILAGHEIHHRKIIIERYLEPLRAGAVVE